LSISHAVVKGGRGCLAGGAADAASTGDGACSPGMFSPGWHPVHFPGNASKKKTKGFHKSFRDCSKAVSVQVRGTNRTRKRAEMRPG